MDSRYPKAAGGSCLIVDLEGTPNAWRELLELRARTDRELAELREENARLRRQLGKPEKTNGHHPPSARRFRRSRRSD